MNYIKINYKHNMIKLIVLRALDLRRGWYDNREICQLTGLKYCTIHTHTGYWSETMLNKEGKPVHLLKRIPLQYTAGILPGVIPLHGLVRNG